MSYPQQQRSMFGPGGVPPINLAALLQAGQPQPQQAPPMTPDQQMSFGLLTGGQAAPSAPGAASAAETEIMAEARRRLGQQAGHQQVLDLRQKQWMGGKRSAADGFLPGEEDWVKKNQHLIGSQGNRASGMAREDVVFSGDGYKTIFDKNGRAIGTNRPIGAQANLPPDATELEQRRRGDAIGAAVADQFNNPPAGAQQYAPEAQSMFAQQWRETAAKPAAPAAAGQVPTQAAQAPAQLPFTFGRENLADTFRKAAGTSAADPGIAVQGPLRSAALPQGMPMEQANATLAEMEKVGGVDGKPGKGPAFAGSGQRETDAERADLYRKRDEWLRTKGAMSDTEHAAVLKNIEDAIRTNASGAQQQATATTLPQSYVDKWASLTRARDIALPGNVPVQQPAEPTLASKKESAVAAVAGQSEDELRKATAKAEAVIRDPNFTPEQAEAARAETVRLRMGWIKKLPPVQREAELQKLLGGQTAGDIIAGTKGVGTREMQLFEADRLGLLDALRGMGNGVSDWWTGDTTPSSDALQRYLAELKLKREAAK